MNGRNYQSHSVVCCWREIAWSRIDDA